MTQDEIHVLLVEDDPGDIELTRASLEAAKIRLDLAVVTDGEAAMDYLYKRGEYEGVPTPQLVIMDLNLPRKNGREVLADMRADSELKKIPVVVLTTSDADEDIARSYANGANCYVTKPLGLKEFDKVVHSIGSFWFTVVRLPLRW